MATTVAQAAETLAQQLVQIADARRSRLAVLWEMSPTQRVAAMRGKAKHASRVVTYGTRERADVRAVDIETVGVGTSRFRLLTPTGETEVMLGCSFFTVKLTSGDAGPAHDAPVVSHSCTDAK